MTERERCMANHPAGKGRKVTAIRSDDTLRTRFKPGVPPTIWHRDELTGEKVYVLRWLADLP